MFVFMPEVEEKISSTGGKCTKSNYWWQSNSQLGTRGPSLLRLSSREDAARPTGLTTLLREPAVRPSSRAPGPACCRSLHPPPAPPHLLLGQVLDYYGNTVPFFQRDTAAHFSKLHKALPREEKKQEQHIRPWKARSKSEIFELGMNLSHQ